MTDTTKWQDQILNELTGFEPEMNKHYCKHCGNLYKHPGTCKNHIKKEHPKRIQMELNKKSEEHDLNRIRYYHILLFTETDRAIKEVNRDIAEAKIKLNKDFEYSFSWVTETLLINLEKRELLKLVKQTIEHGYDLENIEKELIDLRNDWENDIINNFPTHNSTNELSNIHDRLKYKARAEFVNNRFGGGHLAQMITIAKELNKLVDKVIPITEIF